MENQDQLALSKLPTTSSTALQTWSAGPALAAERTRIMFGCYRKGDANDPEMYTTAIAAVLAEYPADIVRRVTDPVRGLPTKLNWLPTVAEVVKECDFWIDFSGGYEARLKAYGRSDEWRKKARER
jgi:hypothetical protein